jgi:Glyoxalase-like domain
MALEVDHVFICCSPGAPEAEALVRLGLREGSSNTHPGQGTANRRFFFDNAFLELLWVSDPVEALSAQTRPTRLWERWSSSASGGCSFGIVFRSIDAQAAVPPFATWSYHPNYLPADLVIEFAEGTSLEEPELIYLPFVHRSGPPAHEPTDHALPIQQLCGVTVELPSAESLSQPSEVAQSAGLLTYRLASEYVLELNFVAAEESLFDLRPTLPLRFRGVVPDEESWTK